MSIKIIIVEDDPIFHESLKTLIEFDSPFEILASFYNATDMLGFISRNNEADLILLDIGLPGISGTDAIKQIKSIMPGIKIIMLTVFDDDTNIFNALKKGANGYLLKAEPEERIIWAIKEVVSGGGIFSPSIASKILAYFSNKNHDKYNLTEREKDVLISLTEGNSKKMIAEKIFISYGTVDSHIKNIYKKLHVNSGIQAVSKAIKEGII